MLLNLTESSSFSKLAAGLIVVEVSDLSSGSDDLSVDLASSIASVVSRPAVESGVDLPVQLAEVGLVKDVDVVGAIVGTETILFVAAFTVARCRGFFKDFVGSFDISISPVNQFYTIALVT